MPPRRGKKRSRPNSTSAPAQIPDPDPNQQAGPSQKEDPPLYGVYGESDDEDESKPTSRPQPTNLMKIISRREIGVGCNAGFPNRIFRAKAKDYMKIKSHTFHDNEHASSYTGYFFRPGKNSVVSAYFIEIAGKFYSSATLMHYDLTRVPENTYWIVVEKRVADACQVSADPDVFVCVVPYVERNGGRFYIAVTNPLSPSMITNHPVLHPRSMPIWCCNSSMQDGKFALGCNKEILLSTVDNLEEIRPVKYDIYAIAYNQNGNVLNLGTETGDFLVYDLRENVITRKKVDKKVIDDILMLDDENYCVISGVSGNMCKLDLRMMKPVVTFPEHNRRSKRIPVSVNEKFDYLCASGEDDRTRVWCLRTGKLLNAFTHPSTYPGRACILRDDPLGKIHLFQDQFIHVYNMIN